MPAGPARSKRTDVIVSNGAEIHAFWEGASQQLIGWYTASSHRNSKHMKRSNGGRELSFRRANKIRKKAPRYAQCGLTGEQGGVATRLPDPTEQAAPFEANPVQNGAV